MERLEPTIETYLESSVVASGRGRNWPGIDIMTARIEDAGFEVDGLCTHTLAMNVGRAFHVEGRIDGRRARSLMEPGMLKIVEAGPRSVWRWDPGEPIEMLHVSVAAAALADYAGELELTAPPELPTRVGFRDAELARLAAALAAELQSPLTRSLVADALRIELVSRLLAEHSASAGAAILPRASNRIGLRTLRRIDEYVDAHLGQTIGIDDLAEVAGLSRFHFARLFRATVGTTPHRYVLERRLDRARELLRSPRAVLRDVAVATGFADQSHLTRLVKRRYGVTPAILRAG
jgi:AraC family transcriptional regulator